MSKETELIPIGRLSKLTKIPISTLRYYDEIDLFKPYYVDPETNYRYYITHQLYDIDFIISWRQLGFSVNYIKKLIQNPNIENMISLFKDKEAEIKHNIQRLKELKTTILKYKSKLEDFPEKKPINNFNSNIVIKDIEPMEMVYVSSIGYNYIDYRISFNKLNELITKHNISVKDFTNIRSHYHDNPFLNRKSPFELMIPIKEKIERNYGFIKEVTSYRCASIIHHGEYNYILKQIIEDMVKWLNNKKYQISNDIIFVHLIGTPIINNPRNFITEIRIPIKN
jgi:DNA-binding transcriptional MerR regulator/DNA gyrase inhibitor GyrI